MASLIKNQILKHLSKFAKNLTVDQISVEVLKGKGALQNIEINEVVLTEVLELPAWLRIQKATCTQIAIKIPWTSLKTLPVKLYIDEIRVEVVMSSDLRQNSPSAQYSTDFTSYNFANRVAEGMSLYINTVEIFFTSEAFGGSFMLSRLCVESRTPAWKEASDLPQTRIKDTRLQQVLVFKQVSWQLLRIEASNAAGSSDEGASSRQSPTGGFTINAPLRLLTNQGQCRITMKKSTVDGSVIAGRLQLILGDILWVATLPQVRSAIYFYLYVMDLIKKAAESSKVQKAEKLLQQADLAHMMAKTTPMGTRLIPPQARSGVANVSEAFMHFDIVETSYHFYGARIDLHICDEPTDGSAQEKSGNSSNDGALQLTLQKLSFDFYPYHLAGRDRSSWIYYKDRACSEWILSSLDSYYNLFSSKLSRKAREEFRAGWPKLMSQCCVIRLDDIAIHCVTRSGDKGAPEKLFSGDREVLKLPDDMPVLHAEFSDYYYASERCQHLPVPPSNTHAQWNPVRIFLDYRTLRWISYVYLDVCNALGLKSSSFGDLPHRDVHIQALMPRIIIPTEASTKIATDRTIADQRPNCLVIQAANVVADNTLLGRDIRAHDSLRRYVAHLEGFPLFGGDLDEFTVGDVRLASLPTQTEAFRRYLTSLCEMEQTQLARDNRAKATSGPEANFNEPKGSDFVSASHDVWSVALSPLWIDFSSPNPTRYPRPMPFVSDVPITMWMVPNLDTPATDESKNGDAAMLTILLRLEGALKILMDRDQFSFLCQLAVDLNQLVQSLLDDAKKFADAITANDDSEKKSMANVSLCVCGLGPTVDLWFLLPSTNAIEVEAEAIEPLVSASSSDVSSLTRGANVAFAGVPSNFDSSYQQRPQAPDGFLPGNFAPEMDAGSIDIAIGSTLPDDAVSAITDISDMDDDNFVQIESPESSPFDEIYRSHESPRRNQSNSSRKVFEAMEAYEEEAERLCDQNKTAALIDLTTRVLQRKVSIFALRLKQSQFGFVFAGDESRLTMVCPAVGSEEHHDITLEEAHKLLNSKAPVNLEQSYGAALPRVAGGFPVELRSGAHAGDDAGYLDLDLRRLELSMRDDTLRFLSDFLQEEPDAVQNEMKMRIHVMDSTILITAPTSPEPVRVTLESVWVHKMADDKGREPKPANESHRIADLERENAELRRKLSEATALVQRLAKDKPW